MLYLTRKDNVNTQAIAIMKSVQTNMEQDLRDIRQDIKEMRDEFAERMEKMDSKIDKIYDILHRRGK